MSSGSQTGTPDVTYNLVSVIYHALQGVQTYQVYARDAQQSGDQDLAAFFEEAGAQNQETAERAKKLLGENLAQR